MFEKKGGSTTQYQEHVPIGYAYYLVCRFDATENVFRSYTAKRGTQLLQPLFATNEKDSGDFPQLYRIQQPPFRQVPRKNRGRDQRNRGKRGEAHLGDEGHPDRYRKNERTRK